jgi:hypothetical protein
VKKPTPLPRASHVNSGTSVPRHELPWPEQAGRVLRHRKLHLEHDKRPDVTPLGGLVLPLALLRRFKVAQHLDARVQVLKLHLPFHESDHILAQALMLYAGGSCLEDLTLLQQDPALLKILGAVRTPDPTTAGDFLRRFVPAKKLETLRTAIDEIQDRVWSNPKRWRLSRRRKNKRPLAVLYLDGHLKQLSGATREGANFSYKGQWSYNVLIASLDDGECVGLRLRPGNVRSSDGAAELLDETLPRLLREHDTVLVIADSDYDRADLRDACERHGCYFAFVGRETPNRPKLAAKCKNWRPYRTRASRQAKARKASPNYKRRRKPRDRRKPSARARGYTELHLVKQEVAETTGPDGTRLVIRRQTLDVEKGKPGQRELWHQYRFRYVVTNLPSSWAAEDIIDETYKRCDQENLIAGLGSGIAAWRMPVAQMRGNAAWLEIARLAWNLGKWVAQMALAQEVPRWEWKRFRRAFVDLPVQVVCIARQLRVRVLGEHRFASELIAAHQRLQI